MSRYSSNTTFFSFGPGESHISKSFEGLKYRNLPSDVEELVTSSSTDTHWAVLGPIKDSWVVSFKDLRGKSSIKWGNSIPQQLQQILQKLTPTAHLRVFLGSENSFIAWDPSFIRWSSLPQDLESRLQSWLTPSGWKAGPPRIVTWGPNDAFFAISEYGEVKWKLGTGETWPIFKETIEEWNEEAAFAWADLAYISLDCTTSDQFVAIRQDRTWAGSIDDNGEEDLEGFAFNFFYRAKPKSRSKPYGQQPNGTPKPIETVPNAATQALYNIWATETASSFATALAANGGATTNGNVKERMKAPKKLQIRNQTPKPAIPTTINGATTGKLLSEFPYLPTAITTCMLQPCVALKADPSGLRACKHDVEALLRASGLYSYEWMKQERLRWHPDRFGRLCEEQWRYTGRALAEEMFKTIDSLMTDLSMAGQGTAVP